MSYIYVHVHHTTERMTFSPGLDTLSDDALQKLFEYEQGRVLDKLVHFRPDAQALDPLLATLRSLQDEFSRRGMPFSSPIPNEHRNLTFPPKHIFENERLASLRSYDVLDTIEEQEFDELTQLASAICGVPISLISLVDQDRQWFKSHHGLDARETPIEQSFCAHAIVSADDVFVVPDPHADVRFKDNPLVTGEPHIGFYAGVPLIGEDKLPLGTLCIIDQQKRELTPEQIAALKTLARQVVARLELRKKVFLLQEAEKKLQAANHVLSMSEAAQGVVIGKQNIDLARSFQQLKRSNEDLQQFAHVASHDLREPVRKLQFFLNSLRDDSYEHVSASSQQAIDKMDKSIRRMSSMILGILDYSQEDGSALTDAVDLDDIFNGVLEDLELLVTTKSATIVRGKLGVITGSATQLAQLFSNLLINALKFSGGNSPAKILIEAEDIVRGGKLYRQIKITDNGIGFEQHLASQIFQTFCRLNSKDRYEGNGIGLALCLKIVTRHEGFISAASMPGEGSTFTVLLPANAG